MPKNLLFQLDPDSVASCFDTIVGHDGGADVVHVYAGMTPAGVGQVTDGCIFARPPKDKHHAAIFVGGSVLAEGEALYAAVQQKFFADFRVSVMLDSNGANTTAAAAVAMLGRHVDLPGKRAVVLAGTGPVGQRAAAMLAMEGAEVSLTSRSLDRAQDAAAAVAGRFGFRITPLEAPDGAARARAIQGAQLVIATGKAGVQLLEEPYWRDQPDLLALADANATPSLGIGGVELLDRGVLRHGKTVYGAVGFGGVKLLTHRACIRRLFERHDLLLDAREIYAIAKAQAAAF